MDGKLRSKAISGVKWTSINTLFTSISAPIYQVILAILLTPQEFAYIAIISLLIGLSTLLSDVGVGEALIQKDKVTVKQLSSLFYLNVLIAIIIAVTLSLLSPYIQQYYALPNLVSIINILAISVVFNGLSSIFRVYVQKKLLFNLFSLIQILKTFLDIVLSVILISIGFGIFGYIYATVVSTLINLFLLVLVAFIKTDFKLKFYFKFREVLPFLNFGISISLKKILTYITQRLDEVIIGGTLSSDTLGIYYFGKRLILQLQTVMTKSFSQVLLPVFSLIKDDSVSLRNTYLKITYFAGMIGIPIFVGLSLVSHLFVPVFFGEQWIESINIIRVLSLVMIFQILTANTATSMLYAKNKPTVVLLIDIIVNTIYLIVLLQFSSMGLEIIILLYSAYTIVKAIVLQKFVGKELQYSLFEYFYQLRNIIISTLVMAITVFLIENYFFNNLNSMFLLIICVFFGIFVYTVMEYLIDKKNVRRLISLVKSKGK